MPDNEPSLQKELVKNLLSERKSDRRWRNIRFVVWVFIIILYAILIFAPRNGLGHRPKGPYVALLRLHGVIMANTSFSARKVIPRLNKAFRDKRARGIVLLINSPGGSPVQASMIHDKIEELKHRYHKKVVVVGEDALASGAYLVASAADKIYVNKDTLTGSIGVIMNGFGFVDTIQKLGITRRVFTAGIHKDRLDPFKPLTSGDDAKVKHVLAQVHADFINDVKAGRKGKLRGDPKELFSGDFWTGSEAVKLGLADGTANLWTVTQQEFGASHYRDYSAKPSLMETLLKGMATELNIGLTKNNAHLQAIMQ